MTVEPVPSPPRADRRPAHSAVRVPLSAVLGSAWPLVVAPPRAGCLASVVVPARDEAGSIAGAIDALARQVDAEGRPLPRETYEVIVVANNCRDDTPRVAARAAARHPDLAVHVAEVLLPLGDAHVGAARRLAMDEACRRLMRLGRLGGAIASTDADTTVAPTWLAATLRELARGVGAVGGRILVAPDERRRMAPRLRSQYLRDVGYRALAAELEARLDPLAHDPWPRHDQYFGGSLALTAAAYRRVGGLPARPALEDMALERALRRADVPIRHSPDVRVFTSGRLRGRTPNGLAVQLSTWAAGADDDPLQLVPSAAAVAARATARRLLRAAWCSARRGGPAGERAEDGRRIARIAALLGAEEPWLRERLAEPLGPGALLDDAEARGRALRGVELVEVREAIAGLRALLRAPRPD